MKKILLFLFLFLSVINVYAIEIKDEYLKIRYDSINATSDVPYLHKLGDNYYYIYRTIRNKQYLVKLDKDKKMIGSLEIPVNRGKIDFVYDIDENKDILFYDNSIYLTNAYSYTWDLTQEPTIIKINTNTLGINDSQLYEYGYVDDIYGNSSVGIISAVIQHGYGSLPMIINIKEGLDNFKTYEYDEYEELSFNGFEKLETILWDEYYETDDFNVISQEIGERRNYKHINDKIYTLPFDDETYELLGKIHRFSNTGIKDVIIKDIDYIKDMDDFDYIRIYNSGDDYILITPVNCSTYNYEKNNCYLDKLYLYDWNGSFLKEYNLKTLVPNARIDNIYLDSYLDNEINLNYCVNQSTLYNYCYPDEIWEEHDIEDDGTYILNNGSSCRSGYNQGIKNQCNGFQLHIELNNSNESISSSRDRYIIINNNINNVKKTNDTNYVSTAYCINKDLETPSNILYYRDEVSNDITNYLDDGTFSDEIPTHGFNPYGENVKEALATIIYFGDFKKDPLNLKKNTNISDRDLYRVAQSMVWSYTNGYSSVEETGNVCSSSIFNDLIKDYIYLDHYNELNSETPIYGGGDYVVPDSFKNMVQQVCSNINAQTFKDIPNYEKIKFYIYQTNDKATLKNTLGSLYNKPYQNFFGIESPDEDVEGDTFEVENPKTGIYNYILFIPLFLVILSYILFKSKKAI